MPTHAVLLACFKSPPDGEVLDTLRCELLDFVSHEPFLIESEDFYSDGPLVPVDPESSILPTKPHPDGFWFNVNLWRSYYGPGYEHGDVRLFVAVAEWLENRCPGCEIWYGDDSNEESISPFGVGERSELLEHFRAVGYGVCYLRTDGQYGPPDIVSEKPSPRPRRRWRRRIVWALVIATVWVTYFWWPRPMPNYIVLPAGHSETEVKSWLSYPPWDWGVYRHFYVRTRVAQPMREVLADLTKKVASSTRRVLRESHPWLTESNGIPVADFTDWQTACRQLGDQASRCESDAHRMARPRRPTVRHGEALPRSFLTFWVPGTKDVDGATQQVLFYRLTSQGESVTVVEIWDLSSFDH